MNKTLVRMPVESYDLFMETLEMDARSSAFDRNLREQLSDALETVDNFAGFYLFVTDDPLDTFSSKAYTSDEACKKAAARMARKYIKENTGEEYEFVSIMFVEILPDGKTNMSYQNIHEVATW